VVLASLCKDIKPINAREMLIYNKGKKALRINRLVFPINT